jgi:hypothetical protein
MSKKKSPKTTFVFTDAILILLEQKCSGDSAAGKDYGKIKGVLEDFAEHIGRTPGRLRVLDVYDQRGGLSTRLTQYIDTIPRREKQTLRRWKNYKSEIRTRIRTISNLLFTDREDGAAERSFDESLLDVVPEALRPILPHLPRHRSRRGLSEEERIQVPLSKRGLILLSVLVKVWNRLNLSSVEELFVNHSVAVRREIRDLGPIRLADSAFAQFYKIRKLLRMKIPPRNKSCLVEVDEWPPTLRGEWEKFELLAINGAGADHELTLSAKRMKVSVKKLSPLTIKSYKEGVGYALSVIRPAGDLSILDLIRLVPRENLPADYDGPKEHNHLVDLFRSNQQGKAGTVRRPGYDSACFARFVNGIKAIAARNGYGRYIRSFNQAYHICLDDESKDLRNAKKKAGIQFKWVEGEIERLLSKFLQIVNSGSFRRTPGRLAQARSDIFFVFFFVWFVTLRYMGYRQQSIVDCVVGKNFISESDGTIILQFDKTKNNKRIKMELRPDGPGTHILLWEVLNLYYKKVYPYVVRQSGNSLAGQLFVVTTNVNFFRPFKESTDFDDAFRRGRNRFLNITELAPEVRYELHPHFLRGFCADWMIIVLGMSFEEAAEVLGDDPRTLKLAYVDKKRVHDAGAVFEAVNKRRQALQLEMGASVRIETSLERIEKKYQAVLIEKDKEIAELRRQREKDMARIAELTA